MNSIVVTRPLPTTPKTHMTGPSLSLLAVDVIGTITQFLSGKDVGKLMCVGSLQLTARLTARGGVDRIEIPQRHQDFVAARLPGFLANFPYVRTIVSLFTDIYAAYSRGFGPMRVADLPPSLTELTLHNCTSLAIFMAKKMDKEALLALSPETYTWWQDKACIPSWAFEAHQVSLAVADPSLWLDTKTHLPNLAHLEILGTRYAQSMTSPSAFMNTLPPGLETFGGDFFSDLTLGMIHTLPKSATRLKLGFRTGYVTPVMTDEMLASMPPSLTCLDILQCSSRFAAFSTPSMAHLRILKISRLTGHPEDIRQLPRRLTFLRARSLGEDPDLRSEDIPLLPSSLTYLNWPRIPDGSQFAALPRDLQVLTFCAPFPIQARDISLLPKGLFRLCVPSITGFVQETVTQLPKHLTDLAISNTPFYDEWLPFLPKSLTRFECNYWKLTGFLLRENITDLDVRTLKSSLYSLKGIQLSITNATKKECAPLKHLPNGLTRVQGGLYIDQIPVRSLPSTLTTLPSHYPLVDTEENVAHLPAKLMRLTMHGPFRFSSWQRLPPRACVVTGAVLLEDEDICNALQRIRKMEESDPSEGNASGDIPASTSSIPPISKRAGSLLPKVVRIPESLEEVLSPNVPRDKDGWRIPWPAACDWHALWEYKHFSQLPSSLTELTIRAPLPADTPFLHCCVDPEQVCKHVRFGSVQVVCELPETLVKLVLCPANSLPVENGNSERSSTELNTFRACKLNRLMLPTSLTDLQIYGSVYFEDLVRLPEMKQLKSLALSRLSSEETLDEQTTLAQFLRDLPSSLEKFHLIRTPISLEAFKAIPRSILDLSLTERTDCFSLQYIRALPPSLTSLRINTRILEKGSTAAWPKSLTSLDLGSCSSMSSRKALEQLRNRPD